MSTAGRRRGWLSAILAGRCPRCRKGRIFRGQLAMNAVCPTCGLRLARDEGYFTGAMIFSYTFAVPLLAALTWGLLLIARWPLEWALAGATLALLAFVPGIFRYSRIVWIYLDRVLDPEDEPD